MVNAKIKWDLNTTEAYLFQSVKSDGLIKMAWETCDIQDYMEDENYRLIGTVAYNTETHKLVDEVIG